MDRLQSVLTALAQSIDCAQPQALVSKNSNNHPGNNDEWLNLPAEVLPPEFNQVDLAGGIDSVEKAQRIVSEAGSKFVFAFPHPLPHGRMARTEAALAWRERFGKRSFSEVLVDTLFAEPDDPLFNPASQLQCLCVLAPLDLVASRTSGGWRNETFPNRSAVVIELGELIPGIACKMVCVAFFSQPGSVRLFSLDRISEDTKSGDIVRDLKRLLKQPRGKTKFGYVLERELSEDYPCTYDFYSEETEKLRQQPAELGDVVPLNELVDRIPSVRPCIPGRGEPGEVRPGLLCINGRSITEDGRVVVEENTPVEHPVSRLEFLQPGDLCIREIFRANEDRGFVVGVFEEEDEAFAAGREVIALRPKPHLTRGQRLVLLQFLRSPIAGGLTDAKGMNSQLAGMSRVNTRLLMEFPVPLADKELTEALGAMNIAREAFVDWDQECAKAIEELINMTDAGKSRRALVEAGQLARQRYTAGTQVQLLDFKIRTQYPHPVAYLWRYAMVGDADHYKRFRGILNAAEGLTCFLATVAIVMARANDKTIRYLPTMADRMAKGNGTNFGDWFAILQEANTSKAFRELNLGDPLVEVTTLFDGVGAEDALRWLMKQRNDDSHGRIRPASIGVDEADEAVSKLEAFYEAAQFLTDLRLILMESTKFDALKGSTSYRAKDLTGDNSIPPILEDSTDRNDLDSGGLYLTDRSGDLHLLRPLLHYLECPECQHLSTFYLDTYSGQGDGAKLKSFERGSLRDEDVANDLRIVGLLPASVK